MWMAQKLAGSQGSGTHQLGKVMGRDAGKILVQGDTDYKSLPIAAPYGVTSLPPDGETAVVLSSPGDGRTDICVGVTQQSALIQPGELLLRSAGGATIYLENDGSVVINGQTIGGNV